MAKKKADIQKELVEINSIFTNTGQIDGLPKNPRIIKDHKFVKLVKSIQEFPEMLQARPIVVDENMVVLGGNMRLKACIEAGLTTVPIMIVKGWTTKRKSEFIIKDNVGFGEWDWDILANTYDNDMLIEWGLEVWGATGEEINLEDFFEEDTTESANKNRIVLEYTEEEYEKIIEKFNSLEGSKENIVWKLLEL